MTNKPNRPFLSRLLKREKPAEAQTAQRPADKPELAKAKLVPSSEKSPELPRDTLLDQKATRPTPDHQALHMRDKITHVLGELAPEYSQRDVGKPGLTKEDARAVLKAALRTLDSDGASDFAQDKPGVETTLTKERWQRGIVRPGAFSFQAKAYFEPSVHGIDQSEVSKLEVRDFEGNCVANYDRGWDVEPEPGSPEDQAVKQIVAFYRENARDMPYQDWPPENAQSEAVTSPQQAGNPMGFFERSKTPLGHEDDQAEQSEGSRLGWTEAEKQAAMDAERERQATREAAEDRQMDDPGREL